MFASQLAISQPKLTVDFCRIVHDWQRNRFTFQELCSKYPGNFCLGLASEGQAICIAGNGRYCANIMNTGQGLCVIGDGAFCSAVQNIAQGLCSVLQGDQCMQRPDTENFLWIRRIEDACRL